MALTCYNNARECTGCMTCQEQEAIYTCSGCRGEIHEGNEYIELYGLHFHKRCTSRWAMKDWLDECLSDHELLELLLERELVEVEVAGEEAFLSQERRQKPPNTNEPKSVFVGTACGEVAYA